MSYQNLTTPDGRHLTFPLLQGGMGVGISLGRLAGAVAREGCMGTLSTADCGYREPDFYRHPDAANLRALREEIHRAFALSRGNGLIAVNAMVASTQYADAVRAAVDAGVDAVVSGAGIPLSLPEYAEDGPAMIAPIVSSGRAAALICKTWHQRYHRLPDFVVLEGCEAGGHLGFKKRALLTGTCAPLSALIPEVIDALAPYRDLAGRDIPIFAAGGIRSRSDLNAMMALGAAGVQVATPFIATKECDASQDYKQVLIDADPEEIRIVQSPVGMPGRALNTPLMQHLDDIGRIPPRRCSHCIKSCDPAKVPYCITEALIQAARGNRDAGLFFCGSQIAGLQGIRTVKDVVADFC
ncbi:NAD(P)H-dependent flavin oxidoreductase [Pseudoramibacter alactolyticus]|uniref:NAD(P)H-dependent flavin oxidoreductase n=1 Tax=Pseudoramibacter alactolyticus TaxID=113287 RepID=UPI00235619FA|nr:nitronate monooxygenase family protein [Pseudoramibacter alactolyticus]MBM6968516.1 nitronate monooxygenase [Pseudoramibacter alactolyticus]